MNETQNLRQHISDYKVYCTSCGSVLVDSSRRYRDTWGQIWYRESLYYIRRVSDDCVGLWNKGIGMEDIT